MKPQFYILAGPNGAGKSTYVHELLPAGTFIFNGDQVFADLQERYPSYPPFKLKGGVPQQLEKDKAEAIAERRDFCFESNYSNDMATDITREFKRAGYETNLIYLGLDNKDEAILRVMSRVVTGGHNIDANEITFNLEEGIKRVNVDLGLYDRIQFVDTSIKYAPVRFAHYLKSCDKISISSEHIKWFNENFRGPIIKLHNERITASQKPRKTARQKRGRRP